MRWVVLALLVAFVAVGSDYGRDWTVGHWPYRAATAFIALVATLFGPAIQLLREIGEGLASPR